MAHVLWTSVVKKFAMALTGVAMIVFLIAHLAGNLTLFAGAETFNHYSHTLTSNPLIYLAEFILLALFLLHVVTALDLTRRNRRARPTHYYADVSAGGRSRKTLASATMVFSGLVLLLFVPLHVWTLKFGADYPFGETGMRDLHRLVLEVFANPLMVLWYVLAMGAVALHLWHGASSWLQSLGLHSTRHGRTLIKLGQVFALAVGIGFALIPIAVFLGVVS